MRYCDQCRQALRRPVEPGLAASVTVMDQPAAVQRAAIMQSLLQRIEYEAGVRGA